MERYGLSSMGTSCDPAPPGMAGGFFLPCYPDYLPYFNELAGSHPERILVDSDWTGGKTCSVLPMCFAREKWTTSPFLTSAARTSVNITCPLLPGSFPSNQRSGWVAISMFSLKVGWPQPVGAYSWLEAYKPVAVVGRSILSL